jgi:replicative DNA helicase
MIEQRVGKKVELIVVDYLQFISPDEAKMPREQQVATTAKRLKQLAKDRRCPVVAVSSMNRKNEDGNDKRPKLSMLRESGGIEFDADVVLLLHREEYYLRGDEAKEKEGLAEVIIAKQRNGPCTTVELRWDAKHTRFQNLAPERFQEFDGYNEQAGGDFGDYDARRSWG